MFWGTIGRKLHDIFGGERACPHRPVAWTQVPCHCPDCGVSLRVTWQMLICRECRTRRPSVPESRNRLRPVARHCRHCGGQDVEIRSQQHIEAYELPYAHPRITHATGPKRSSTPKPAPRYHVFSQPSQDIVEGQVIRKTEYILYPGNGVPPSRRQSHKTPPSACFAGTFPRKQGKAAYCI